jgi:hypothetical protein
MNGLKLLGLNPIILRILFIIGFLPILVFTSSCRGEIVPPSFTPAVTTLLNPSPTATPVQGEEIPFETISIGEDSNYENESPGLMVASQLAEIAPLEKVVFRMPGENLDPSELEDNIAVAVFQGWKPTDKYGVEVQRVTRASAGEVRLYTHFTEPDPNFEKAPIITSPYHLIRIHREGLQGEVTFILYADGEELLRETHTIAPPPNEVIFPNINSSYGATATP